MHVTEKEPNDHAERTEQNRKVKQNRIIETIATHKSSFSAICSSLTPVDDGMGDSSSRCSFSLIQFLLFCTRSVLKAWYSELIAVTPK
jgi:hypothetical protein